MESLPRAKAMSKDHALLIRAGRLALRFGLAAVFLYAGTAKALTPHRFAVDIESYRIAPVWAALALAYYLPWLEIACGLGLLARRTAPGATLIAGTLMSAFMLALLSAWGRGLEIRCGCFGAGEASASDYPWWLLRDLALLAGCAALWRDLRSRSKPEKDVL
jgi:putative oxidoreductase